MTVMRNPIGQVFYARDGGLHAPLDTAAFDYIQAQAQEGGGEMEVKGVAVKFGVVGHFGYYGAMRLEAGAIVEAPAKNYKYRDVLGLYAHNSDQVLGRVGANTLTVSYNEGDITYSMRLNKRDSLAQDVWARLQRGDLNSASIGFVPVEGEWQEEQADNSLDAEGADKIDVFAITKAELVEVSIVAQGAFAGATSAPADAQKAPQEAQEAPSTPQEAELPLPLAEVAALVLGAADSSTDDTVETDGTDQNSEPDASTDLGQGGESDVTGTGAEDFGGPAEGAAEEEGAEEAEAQGLTLKDIVGRWPHDIQRRLSQ